MLTQNDQTYHYFLKFARMAICSTIPRAPVPVIFDRGARDKFERKVRRARENSNCNNGASRYPNPGNFKPPWYIWWSGMQWMHFGHFGSF